MAIILQHDGKIFIGENPYPNDAVKAPLVLLENATEGDCIMYDGERWVVGKPLPLAITSPQDGDVLTYDSTNGVWKNVAPETPAET